MERTEYYCTLGDNCDGRGNQSEDCKSCKQVRMGDNTGSQVHPNMALPSKQGEETSRLDGGGALFRLLEEHEVTQMILESGIRHLTSNLYHFASGLEARVIAAYSDAAMGLVANTGAAGAGEVKTWRQRAEEGDQDALTGDQCLRLAEQEINDLRAQLARLQAPVGETIDTREFRKLELAYAKGFYAWEDAPSEETGKALGDARKALIAHIDAQLQLARQRKGSEVETVKRIRELCDGLTINQLKSTLDGWLATPPSAQQEQGDAVRDSERLEFMVEYEAWIGWARDRGSCRVFHRAEDGYSEPIMGWVPEAWAHTAREAIDKAMTALRATNTEGKKQP